MGRLFAAAAALVLIASPLWAQGYPQQGYPQQAYPQQGYPQSGYPQSGYPQQSPPPVYAQPGAQQPSTYTVDELVDEGHKFFGSASRGIAETVERAFSQYGQPNGYVLGEEAGGALVAGLRYGEGALYTKNSGEHRIFWQGPSFGYDFGANGARTMMLIYNLPAVGSMYQRYIGVTGSAYLIGGMEMTVLGRGDTLVVPIRTGVGLRLGANVGYLKFSQQPTWNPI